MGTANLRIVPGLLDIAYRPGNPFDVRLIGWPPGSLTGRTFETRLGTVTFDTDVVGDTIEIHGTTEQTTAAGAVLQRVLTIVDTATDQVLLTGQATASYDGGGITNGIVRVQIGPVDVVVELIDLSGGAAGVSAQLAAHIDATTGAHPASAITAVPVGGLTGDDVAEQLAELDTRATAIETAGSSVSEADLAAAVAAEAAARATADGLLIPSTQKGAASGVAPLGVDGKLATSFLPPLAINETFTVGSQAAMLALTAQRGDVAVRTDLAPAGFFLLTSDSPGTLADWKQVLAPGAVVTVDGRTGAVSLADRYDPAGAAAAVAGNLATEATARTAGDNALDGRLDTLEAGAPYVPLTTRRTGPGVMVILNMTDGTHAGTLYFDTTYDPEDAIRTSWGLWSDEDIRAWALDAAQVIIGKRGPAGQPGINFGTNTDAVIYKHADGVMRTSTGAAFQAARLGIIDVYDLPAGAGAAGQVLTTNGVPGGAGNIAWVDPAVKSVDGRSGVVSLSDRYEPAGAIAAAINALLNGAGPAYDTLKELQDLLTADESTAAALATTVAGKAPSVAQLKAVAVKTGAYSAAPGDYVPMDTTAGTFAVALPTNPADGTMIAAKWIAGTLAPTVTAGGTDVFNLAGGAQVATFAAVNQQLRFIFRATGRIWYIETSFSKAGLDTLYTTRASSAPVVVERTAGVLAIGTTANAWHEPDTTGSSAARNLDVVIPNVAAGQWVKIDPDFSSNSTAAGAYMDMHTVVAGVRIHRIGGDHNVATVGGLSGWTLSGSVNVEVGASVWYQVQASDIENGAIRLRLMDCNLTTTARSLNATAATPLRLVGSGPF